MEKNDSFLTVVFNVFRGYLGTFGEFSSFFRAPGQILGIVMFFMGIWAHLVNLAHIDRTTLNKI